MLSKVPIGRSHSHLTKNDQTHKGKTYGNTNEQLSFVSVPCCNLPPVLGVWIYSNLASEVLSLSCCIFKISDEPFVGNVVLLTFPTLMEKSDPYHYADAIHDAIRRSHHRIKFSSFVKSINDIGYSKEEANDGDRDEPACVMDKPSKVESELLAVVVFDEIERLHICKEAFEQHTCRQTPSIIKPRIIDQVSFRHMHWEVLSNHTTLPHVFHINLTLQCLHDNGLVLPTVELIEHIGSIALKWFSQIVLGEATLDAHYFTPEVYD